MANRTPTPPQGGTARTAAADLDRIQPPFPAFEGCAPPLRVRKGASGLVHTLESNGENDSVAEVGEPLTWRERSRLRRQAIDYPAFGRQLAEHGVDVGFVPPPPASPGEIAFRHKWWNEKRVIVRAALVRNKFPQKVIDRFDNCGSNCWVYGNKKTGDIRIHANTCKNRWCDPCSITKSRIIGGNIRDEMERRRFKSFQHVTLTLVSSTLPLKAQKIAALLAFKYLRNYKVKVKKHPNDTRLTSVNWWSQYVEGGVVCFEPMGKKKTKLFHPHLHLITQSRWIPHAELMEAWRACTRKVNPKLESFIVGVYRIDSYEAAAAEVAQYAGKGMAALAEHFLDDPKKVDELVTAMQGSRLCTTFGSWRGIPLTQTPEFDATEWRNLGSLNDILAKDQAGDDWAARILQIIRAQVCNAPRPPPLESKN